MERYSNRLETFSSKQSDIDYAMERAQRNTPEGVSQAVVEFLAGVALGIRLESIRDGGRMSQKLITNICNNLRVPVLILSGAKDTISTEMRASLIAALPGATEVVFPKAVSSYVNTLTNLFSGYRFAKKVWNLNGF